MPWIRSGDNAATYPALMRTAGDRRADERTVNEVAGFVFRCAFQSGAHMTDYVIDAGTAYMIGGARTDELLRLCVKSGLFEATTDRGMRSWKLLEDPEFIHIRLRKEVEWERQQRNDTRDPALKVPVLRRDGDQCRWCGVVVQWRGRTTKRTGTLDHLEPGQPGTPATMVVACKGCNSARQDNPQWQDDHPLRAAPAAPLYGPLTAEYLTDNGYPTEATTGAQVAQQQAQTRRASADPAPSGVRPASPSSDAVARATFAKLQQLRTRPASADPAPSGVRPASPVSDASAQPATVPPEVAQESGDKSPPGSDRTTPAGSGRDGSGSGVGEVGLGEGSGVGERRGRRGRRGSGSSRQQQGGQA